MIKVENIVVFGFEGSLRGMRNPLNSWHMADSTFQGGKAYVGPKDLDLCKRLIKSGASHRKFLRMIHVQMDITAPLYWWKDYDTYKVATVANGCSTMHKIHAKEFTLEDFAYDELDECAVNLLEIIITSLNSYRQTFVDSGCKDRTAWCAMIKLLPSSYMQKRTVDLNYETILALIRDRRFHKLKEFRNLCEVLFNELPYLTAFYEAGM